MLFLFHRKGSMGLGLPQGRAPGCAGKSPHLRYASGSIFRPNLVSAFAPLPV